MSVKRGVPQRGPDSGDQGHKTAERIITREERQFLEEHEAAIIKDIAGKAHVPPVLFEQLFVKYQTSTSRLLNKTRKIQAFQWLLKAIKTILPHPKSMDAFECESGQVQVEQEQAGERYQLATILIYIWCKLDIMADDLVDTVMGGSISGVEGASTEGMSRDQLIDEFFNSVLATFAKAVGVPFTAPEAIAVEQPMSSVQKDYLDQMLAFTQEITKSLLTFPNIHVEEVKEGIFTEFRGMFESCRFSREYSAILRQAISGAELDREKLEDLRRMAPTLQDYVRLTKHGMGTGFMLAVQKAFLKKDASWKTIDVAIEHIQAMGRLVNDADPIHEITDAEPNSFIHLLVLEYLEGSGVAGSLLLRMGSFKTMDDAAKKAFLGEILTDARLEQWFALYEQHRIDLRDADVTGDDPGLLRGYLSGFGKFMLLSINEDVCGMAASFFVKFLYRQGGGGGPFLDEQEEEEEEPATVAIDEKREPEVEGSGTIDLGLTVPFAPTQAEESTVSTVALDNRDEPISGVVEYSSQAKAEKKAAERRRRARAAKKE